MEIAGGQFVFFFQAEDGIRDVAVTGVQTCALPISLAPVTMLITPAGTSEASSTVYSSVAARGCTSEGIAITVLPTATAGPTSDTNPNRDRKSVVWERG